LLEPVQDGKLVDEPKALLDAWFWPALPLLGQTLKPLALQRVEMWVLHASLDLAS